MKYQKPYRWKSKKIYEENKGWMGKSIGKYRTDDSEDPFFSHFLPFRFLLEKQRRSVKNCPNFSKNNFFTLFCQNFTCFSSIFPSFHSIFPPKSLFFFLRLDFATLNLPTGGRSSVPLTPLNGHSHSLVPMFPLFYFFSLLIKNFHK